MNETRVETAHEAFTGSAQDGQPLPRGGRHSRNNDIAKARNVELLRMRVEGASLSAIAERFKISQATAAGIIRRALSESEQFHVEELRKVENERLDVVQDAIWAKVKKGNINAIDTYLRLSARRAKMNGLDAPQKVVLAGNVRVEMEEALVELERLLGHEREPEENIIDADVVEDDGAE